MRLLQPKQTINGSMNKNPETRYDQNNLQNGDNSVIRTRPGIQIRHKTRAILRSSTEKPDREYSATLTLRMGNYHRNYQKLGSIGAEK